MRKPDINKKVTLAVFIMWMIVFTIWVLTIELIAKDRTIAKTNLELLEAQKPSEIEVLKQMKEESAVDVKTKKSIVEAKELELNSAKEEWATAVWTDRCIETKWILSLSGTGTALDCTQNLNNFSSSNLYNTKKSLGL